MLKFKLKSEYTLIGDQPQAIKKIMANLRSGLHDQILLGVTGSGKTFTMANFNYFTQQNLSRSALSRIS